MIHCLHCHAETSNGLALCELCQRLAGGCFDLLPIYARNLARWRPGRAGSRPVPGSRVLYDGEVSGDGTGDQISDRLDEAVTAFTTWARVLVEARPHFTYPLTWTDAVLTGDLPDETADTLADDPARIVAALTTAFREHLTSVATLDWCGEFVRDVSHHEAVLRGLTEKLVPGWYAGGCRQCGASTYVVPGLTWVACGSCGAYSAARDHLEVILDEARGWVAPPKRIAEAMVTLMDSEQSVPKLYTRIRQWAHKGDLTPIQHTARDYEWDDVAEQIVITDQPIGFARYRFGDVFDRATRREQTSDKGERAS